MPIHRTSKNRARLLLLTCIGVLMPRRVLILTYYFPPSGGAGVQRVLKFVKYLPSFDWRPVVVTVREGAYPARDATLTQDVPPAAEVHRTSSWDAYQVYAALTGKSPEEAVVQGSVQDHEAGWKERLSRWGRANVFLPDARVGWWPFAVWRGWKLLANHPIDAILTTGPPHSTHLAGWCLHRLTGTPWVADFRDPWTDINYYQELPHTPWALWVDRALERGVLRGAQAVTTVSSTWRDVLAQKIESREMGAFRVIQNGYDAADLEGERQSVDDDGFALTHVGSLYASRNPDGLWRALQHLREGGAVPDLRLRLVGTVDPSVRAALRAHDLADVTELVSYVPHDEAVAYMQRAGLLLLSIESFPASAGMLTGKVYEYLASGRPILGVGDADGDAASLLRQTNAGKLFGRTDVDGIAAFVRRHYDAWAEGSSLSGAPAERIRPYRRRAQTERLAAVLDEVAD